MSEDYMKVLERNPTAVRLPTDLLERAEDLVDHWQMLDQDLIKKLGGRRSRSTIIRLALHYGIEQLEALVRPQEATEQGRTLVEVFAKEESEDAEARAADESDKLDP